MGALALRSRWIAYGLVWLLSACAGGGSGDGAPAPANSPPIADAGTDFTVFRNSTVTLDGSRSSDPDGGTLTFKWTQTGGPTVALSSDTAVNPTFAAPRVTASLVFSLVVSDGRTASSADSVSITILNRTPTANAGADRAIGFGSTATLDARASADPDGDTLTYTWEQLSGSATVALQANADGTAVLPAQATPLVLTYGLTVSDGELVSAQDTVTISISSTGTNHAPLVDAGFDQDVSRGTHVVLNGFAFDFDSQPIAIHWEQTGGPTVSLDDPESFAPQFTAPASNAVLTFQLYANDGALEASDSVDIRVQNLPPELFTLIDPSSPGVLDPLTVTVSAQDPEGQPLAFSYAWSRNGSVIAGATSATLAPGNYVRGDTMVATVIASDGEVSTTQTASVTIQDTLPILTSNAPATHPLANPLAFQVSAFDPDGDPVQLALHHGPPGMTSTTSGVVAWTPNLPMFSESLDVHWGVVVVGQPTARLSGTVQVTDALHEPMLRRTLLQLPTFMHGMVVSDLDSDGTPEILVGGVSALYEMRRDGATYFQDWVYPFALGNPYVSSILAVATGKIDADAYQEIFVTSGEHTVGIDGLSRLPLREFDPGAGWVCQDIAAADLNGDGALELVCAALNDSSFPWSTKIIVFHAGTGAILGQSPSFGGVAARIAIGNFDGDAALEIALSSGAVYDGATFANEWLTTPFGQIMAAADVDGDGTDELVANVPGADMVRAYDIVHRTVRWEIPNVRPRSLLAVDLDGDGTTEVLIGDDTFRFVKGYHRNITSGAVEQVLSFDAIQSTVRSLATGDVDGDGSRELVWTAGFGASVFGVASLAASPVVEWSESDLVTDTSFYAGGALATLAPGTQRLVYEVPRSANLGPARFLSLNPATGRLAASTANLELSFAGLADVAVVDYDHDGVDEAFLAHDKTYDVRLTAYDIGASQIERQFVPNVSMASGIGTTSIAQADANGDSFADMIALASDGYVSVYDVHNQALIWRNNEQLPTTADVEAGDLDGDGKAEIVVAAQGKIVVFARGTAPNTFVQSAQYTYETPFRFVHDLLLADTDGNGLPEIFILMGESDATTVYRFNRQLAIQSSFAVVRFATTLGLEDIGSSRKNLIVGSSSNTTEAFIGLRAVDAINGDTIWVSPELPGTALRDCVYYVDVDGDGRKELSFGSRDGMFLVR